MKKILSVALNTTGIFILFSLAVQCTPSPKPDNTATKIKANHTPVVKACCTGKTPPRFGLAKQVNLNQNANGLIK